MTFIKKPALTAACCVALASGGAGAALLASTADASTTGGQSGTGTATIVTTNAKGKTHTETPGVSCHLTKKGTYVLTAREQHGDRGGIEILTVKDDKGAGSYTGRLETVRYGAKKASVRHHKVPVTLTSDGGSFSYSKTLSGKHHSQLAGKTVSAHATWTCAL